MKIYHDITELIGNTPLLSLNKLTEDVNLFAKLECFNPAGSVKDRVAYQMLKAALDCHLINQETVIIEPTSGNTGIGLAAICASLGLKLLIVMPDTMSMERRKLISAYGAQIILSDGLLGMKGAICKANELAKKEPNSFIPSQFENPSNPLAHYNSTGPEIWDCLDGKVDALVCTIGTGGTISGTAKYLKEKNPNIKIIGVEPFESPIITKGVGGTHGIQGIGAGFIPKTLNLALVDEVLTVKTAEAYKYASDFAHQFGLLIGISSGAALKAALEIAKRPLFKGQNIVVIFPDGGDRYLSTKLYD